MSAGEMRRAERLVLQAGGCLFILLGIADLYQSRLPALAFSETVFPGVVFILVGVLLVWRGASSAPPLFEALKRLFRRR